MSTDKKLSKAQTTKIIKSFGSFGYWLANNYEKKHYAFPLCFSTMLLFL